MTAKQDKPAEHTAVVVVEDGKTQEFKTDKHGMVELTSSLGDTKVVAESVPVWLEKGFKLKK